MRTAMQTVILASFVSLALGGIPWVPHKNFVLNLQCCDYVKSLPLFYNDLNDSEKEECPWDSVMSKQGMLNADNSVKEDEFRKRILDEALPDAKAFLPIALDQCFKDLEKDPVKNVKCKSRAQELVECIVSGLIINCPVTMYAKDKEHCHVTTK